MALASRNGYGYQWTSAPRINVYVAASGITSWSTVLTQGMTSVSNPASAIAKTIPTIVNAVTAAPRNKSRVCDGGLTTAYRKTSAPNALLTIVKKLKKLTGLKFGLL